MPTVPCVFSFTEIDNSPYYYEIASEDQYQSATFSQIAYTRPRFLAGALHCGQSQSLSDGGSAFTSIATIGSSPPSSVHLRQGYKSSLSLPDVDDLNAIVRWRSIADFDKVYQSVREWITQIIAPLVDGFGWSATATGHIFHISYFCIVQSGGYIGSPLASYVEPSSHTVEFRLGETLFSSGSQPSFGGNSFSAAPVDFSISDADADTFDQNPGLAFVRVINESGFKSSWAPLPLAPRAFVEATLADAGFKVDAFKSIDFDHGTAKIEWFYNGNNPYQNKAIDISDCANPTGHKLFEFAWEDVQLKDASTKWQDGDTIYFIEKVTDKGGFTDTFAFSVRFQQELAQIGAFLHPNGTLFSAMNTSNKTVQVARQRAQSVAVENLGVIQDAKNPALWQRRHGQKVTGTFELVARRISSKIWGLWRSLNGGNNWTMTGTPFQSTSIDYLDAAPVGNGAIAVAIIKGATTAQNKLVVKRTQDVKNWPDDSDAVTVKTGLPNKPVAICAAPDGSTNFSITGVGLTWLRSKDGIKWE